MAEPMDEAVMERQRPGSLLWLGSIAGAFVLALAALLAPPETTGPESPARVVAALPAPLGLAAVIALALAELVLFGLVVFSDRRRRKRKGDEEFELYHEPPKVSPWALALLLALALLPVVALMYLVWHAGPLLERWSAGGAGIEHPGAIARPPGAVGPGQDRPFVAVPFVTWSVATLAVIVAAGSLALALWIVLGRRLGRRRAGPAPAAPPLVEVVDESLENLRREPDARVAIVKCYRRFEQTMARARVPRAPWQTPFEYMQSALTGLSLPRRAIEGLTDLFVIARFSDHPVGTAERDTACANLAALRTALARRDGDAPAR